MTLLAETGRPAGHATILRELVHGQTGRGARLSDGLAGPPELVEPGLGRADGYQA